MARCKVEMDGIFYVVREKDIYSDDGEDIYHIAPEKDGLECDGPTDECEAGTCNHIKAVRRYQAKH